jgi:hypothetical protein
MNTAFSTRCSSFSHEEKCLQISHLIFLLDSRSYNCHRHGTCLDSLVTLCKTHKRDALGTLLNGAAARFVCDLHHKIMSDVSISW